MPKTVHYEFTAFSRRKTFVSGLLIFLVFLLFLSYASSSAAEVTVDLSRLTVSELDVFIADIDSEIKMHHIPDNDMTDSILSAVKSEVESIFLNQAIQISWAWIHYDYTREWDFYTLTTHIDYIDANGKKQKPDVYAEVFPVSGQYSVYYLQIGTDVVINRREELPDQLWEETPQGIINAATGFDLSTLSMEELTALKSKAENEKVDNHTTNSTVSDLVLSLTKVAVEQYFTKQGIEVSWPWLDYTYTCDWELYALKTRIDYKDTDGNHRSDVYAKVYPDAGEYALYYLAVGDLVLIDQRNQLPEDIAAALEIVQTTATPEPIHTPVPTNEPTPSPTPEPSPPPSLTLSPIPSSSPSPALSSHPVSQFTTEEIAKYRLLETGCEGEDVLLARTRMYELGYFDKVPTQTVFTNVMTEYIKAFQIANSLPDTGILSPAEQAYLFSDYAIPKPLAAPKNVKATQDGGVITVTWQAVEGADEYRVFRSTTGYEDQMLLGDVTTNIYEDQTPQIGQTNYYWIFGVRNEISSPEAGNVNITVPIATPTPIPITTKKMRVTVACSCSGYNHVGNSWTKDYSINGSEIVSGSKVDISLDQSILVCSEITEKDSSPDVGIVSDEFEVSQAYFDSGFTITQTVIVTENRGRYSGNDAVWTVIYKFSP